MYVYGCGVCQTTSRHKSEGEARAERTKHHRAVHHGRVPMGEWIKATTPPPRPTPWWDVARWMVGTWSGRVVGLLLVFAVGRFVLSVM